MILTVTMNPSIDVSYPLEQFNLNNVNRLSNVSKTAGGKGLNVSKVSTQLGAPITATGVVGGHFGNYLTEQLEKDGIPHDFTKIAGETRSCIAILHGGKQTEVLESGPVVTKKEQEMFIENFDQLLKGVEVLTISGSLPKGIKSDFYSVLIKKAAAANVKVLLDTSGETLKMSLKSTTKPFLIKPNETEIADLVGKDIKSEVALIEALEVEKFDGIEWIVVTLGAEGALVKYNNYYYRVEIPTIKVKNSVGSGDSTIAGLAYALYENKTPEEIIKTGMVCGMLNSMEEKTGQINADHFNALLNRVNIEKIK